MADNIEPSPTEGRMSAMPMAPASFGPALDAAIRGQLPVIIQNAVQTHLRERDGRVVHLAVPLGPDLASRPLLRVHWDNRGARFLGQARVRGHAILEIEELSFCRSDARRENRTEASDAERGGLEVFCPLNNGKGAPFPSFVELVDYSDHGLQIAFRPTIGLGDIVMVEALRVNDPLWVRHPAPGGIREGMARIRHIRADQGTYFVGCERSPE